MISIQDSATWESLPDLWEQDRLKDVVSLRTEKTDVRSDEDDYLELEDLESCTGKILSRRNTLDVASAVTIFKKGDVLFGKLRPYLEKYYEATFDGKCTGEILAFKPLRIHSGFLRYCVASSWFIERCNMLAYGTKMPRVNWPTQLAQFNLPIPPFAEQERIASLLDESCAAIDAAVLAKRQQIDHLDAVRTSCIQKAITSGLNDEPLRLVNQDWIESLPEHWQAVRVKRVLLRMDYGISVSTEEEGAYPVLKMGHLRDGEIAFEKLDFVDEVPDELLLENGDLLYNRTNSPDQVGKAAIFRKSREDAVTFASYLVRLRVNHRVKPEFLNYVLNSGGFLGFARRLAIPSVQQSNLNSTRYGRMFIPLPPINEQEVIIERLNSIARDISQTQSILSRQINTLLAYRKSLIHECVTGKRRITSADFSETAAHA